MQIRQACPDDVPKMCECDVYASTNPSRARFITTAVEKRLCTVAVDAGHVLGYVLLTHDFFEHGFISLVVVSPAHRRKGIGLRLIAAAEATCNTTKLFSSANQSNHASQQLLSRAGFQRSGVVENLDDDDPELIYIKFLGLK